MKNLVRIVSIVSVIGLLSACGSGGGGVPATAPSATLDGTVTDAVITNGTLRVFKFDDGKKGELIAETITDGNGDFKIAGFTSQDRPVVIEVSGGRYTEEASGVSVDLLPGQVLRAYMFYEQGSAITLQVTPFTHLASCLADYKIRSGVNVNNAITESTSVFSGLAGVDILGTKPLNITDPNNANFEVTDNLRYGAVLAAISSFTAEVSETNGVSPHRFNQNSSIYATQVLCQDIAADGVFNGSGFINNGNSVGQLSLGSVPLDVDTLRSKVAQHILSIISSDRNQTGLGVDEFVLYANEIASSTDGVFGGVPSSAVDQTGPTVTAGIAPDSFLKGLVNLDFMVTDPIGVKSVQFKVNDVLHSNGQVDTPVMSLNSTNYTDGIIKITVVATDILNNVSSIDFNYVVDNTSPTITLTSATLVNNKAYTATGTYEEQGAPVASIQVNGVDAAIDTNAQTWSADITLLSGQNVVTLNITDIATNTNTVDINVDVDLINPSITPVGSITRFSTFQGQLNLCTSGIFDDNSAQNKPMCVSTDNVSLNGAAINSSLQSNGYLLVGFLAEDPQGAGVFTSRDNLKVEYKYEVDSQLKVDWTTVPAPVGGGTFYLPIVTEYMGSDWYQTTTSANHKVVIRITDAAGNFNEVPWLFQVDVLVPEIAITSIIDDALFNATSFASRTGLDGVSVDVNYTFTNTSNVPILISVNDQQQHGVVQTYETGIRENIARVKVSEIWQSKNCGNNVFTECLGTSLLPVSYITYGPAHVKSGQTASPAGLVFSAYQNVYTDNPIVSDISNVPTIVPLSNYLCDKSNFVIDYYKTKDVLDYYSGYEYRTGIYANGNPDFSVCRLYVKQDIYNTNITTVSNALQSVFYKSVETKAGYPRNNIKSTNIVYVVNTESLSILNATLGEPVLSAGGWYSIPPNSDIVITKRIRLPVLQHYFDSELADLATLGYSIKKLDKAMAYNIDTALTINRVIDPGNIQDVNNVTASISNAGLGIYQKTISR